MNKHDIFVIGASLGGVEALSKIVSDLPADLPGTLFVVLHFPSNRESLLPQILTRVGKLPASHPQNETLIAPGHIYVAPPDYHMTLRGGKIRLDQGPKEHFTRPSANPLFRSAAQAYGSRVVGIVLTGGDSDGAQGLVAIKRGGGISVVQDPDEAQAPSMPKSGLFQDSPDYCLRLPDLARLIDQLSRGQEPDVPMLS
ncbi:MAG: chemotaxis protein CheB [Candidatus Binataceae bacterium]|nr:chemotaxis protein CheB [Candidatus Binataceae bacterium]